jgi:hypothetical protein
MRPQLAVLAPSGRRYHPELLACVRVHARRAGPRGSDAQEICGVQRAEVPLHRSRREPMLAPDPRGVYICIR